MGLFLIEHNFDLEDICTNTAILDLFEIEFTKNNIVLLNGRDVTKRIREADVTNLSTELSVSFLTLAGLKPYLFISRMREVRKYKGLKIFFDDIELLGKYIEIEYQDSSDSEKELNEFCSLCGIDGIEQPLYGDIINKKYEEDSVFRQAFEDYLEKLTKN